MSCKGITEKATEEDLIVPSRAVSFKKDIFPILSDRCQPCHTKKGDRSNYYEEYNTAKTLFTGIIGRVKREIGDPLLMPKNGKKFSKAEMNLLAKWQDDGFLE